ncbi:unnamed protein product [Darwinula stevensoni]|uniref:Cysteine protease n=1 Tax=Darwinula stevensoni TaxID=69355 RepID=A0A7R8XIN6_9CRUS|nr:unnamed protein product [Darwinula stevensoni]CAG0893606.1 unnamed protein product [Darwinula stevensoni]
MGREEEEGVEMDAIEACFPTMESTSIEDVFFKGDEIWLLGRRYLSKDEAHRQALRDDVRTRIWCTYRKGFSPIGGSGGCVSDKGWGCMLRCGQMVLCEALVSHRLGRTWQWKQGAKNPDYFKIINLILDRRDSPFSIHQMALMGASEAQRPVGEWYGPNTVAHILRKLVNLSSEVELEVHVAMDNLVISQEIVTRCKQHASHPDGWTPLLLFIPLRLGLDSVNEIYIPSIQETFRMPQTLGIIGGRPNHALYFIGYSGDSLIYLDPHTTQPAASISLDNGLITSELMVLDSSFHCFDLLTMAAANIDPSLALCFLFTRETEFEAWCETMNGSLLFELQDTIPPGYIPLCAMESQETDGASACPSIEYEIVPRNFDDSDEEFELL